jgi:hypothetical protein
MSNFMDHLAPTNIGGKNIKGADQAAQEVLSKREQRSRTQQPGPCVPYEGDWEKDYTALEKVAKRRNRGGLNFKVGDGLA